MVIGLHKPQSREWVEEDCDVIGYYFLLGKYDRKNMSEKSSFKSSMDLHKMSLGQDQIPSSGSRTSYFALNQIKNKTQLTGLVRGPLQ